MPQNNDVTALQAYEWLCSGEAVLIDVREPDEFKAEHIPMATSIPLSVLPQLNKELKIPPSRKLIFQCQRGKRGGQACALVSHSGGISAVYNIDGGIDAWRSAGLPVVSSATTAPRMSIFRQVQAIVGVLVALGVVLGFSGHVGGFAISGILGAALAFAGISGWCGLAKLLVMAPWNK